MPRGSGWGRTNVDEWEPCEDCQELFHDDDGEFIDGVCGWCRSEREKQRA